jgi:predicted phosphodiesterase
MYTKKQKQEILDKMKGSSLSRRAFAKDIGVAESTLRTWEKQDLTEKKSGMEIKNDHVVVNWTTRSVITEIGEFGTYNCSIDMHGAIMRAYSDSYEGKGITQAELAMRYDFPHAKAVTKYMKAHGMTKSMIGQTDIELEEGLTVEDAVNENIQSLKRQIHKKTERRKWAEIQKASDNWWALHHGVLKPFENHIEKYLPKHKIQKLKLQSFKKKSKDKTVGLVAISDVHYMKMCFDAFGKNIYNRDIAKRELFKHAERILQRTIQSGGIPERFVLPIGNDNLHIDNPMQTTTRGTVQANSTDGSYRLELGSYLDMTMALIETFAQVAPVDVISVPGNHDLHTSYMLAESIKRIYDRDENINVVVRYNERTYLQYGKVCLIISHGDKISLARTKREVHKLILSEAKEQNIDLNEVEDWVFVVGHLHHEDITDIGGNTEVIVMPSISEADDWHSDSGYVGSKKNTFIVLYSYEYGKQTIIYAGREKL